MSKISARRLSRRSVSFGPVNLLGGVLTLPSRIARERNLWVSLAIIRLKTPT